MLSLAAYLEVRKYGTGNLLGSVSVFSFCGGAIELRCGMVVR